MVVTDDFNRADENLEASANWTASTAAMYKVVSNQLDIIGAASARRSAHWSADGFGPDCYTQADYVTFAPANDYGITLRHDGADPATGNLYAARDNDNFEIIKIVAGSFTTLATGDAATLGTWRLEAVGSILTLFVDGVQKVQVTDTSLTDAGFNGFFGFGTDGGVWDNFEAGPLPVPVPVVVATGSGASDADLNPMKHPMSSGAAKRLIVDPDDSRRKWRQQF